MIKKTVLALALLTAINAHADQIKVFADAVPVTHCKADHKCDFHGLHDVDITNDSSIVKPYTVKYIMWVYKQGIRTSVNYKVLNTILQPHETWLSHYDSIFKSTFSYSGGYIYVVETSVYPYHEKSVDIHKEFSVKVKD